MEDNSRGKKSDIITIVFILFFCLIIFLIAAFNPLANPPKGKNSALAKSTLRTLATACEIYAQQNDGRYPLQYEDLISGESPCLRADMNYCEEGTAIYSYECHFKEDGYLIKAIPDPQLKKREDTVFTISTRGRLE